MNQSIVSCSVLAGTDFISFPDLCTPGARFVDALLSAWPDLSSDGDPLPLAFTCGLVLLHSVGWLILVALRTLQGKQLSADRRWKLDRRLISWWNSSNPLSFPWFWYVFVGANICCILLVYLSSFTGRAGKVLLSTAPALFIWQVDV